MRKLKLQLEDLHVDSFHTTTAGDERGTVFAEQCTCYTVCTCPGYATCEASCDGTCNRFTCAPSGCDQSCMGGTCASFCECHQEW